MIVRRAYHLAQIAPRPLHLLSNPSLSETEIETLLSEGQALEAAHMLLCRHAKAVILKTAEHYTAEIQMAGDLITGTGATSPALALLQAWTSLFLLNSERSAL